jgi:SAM-dependent methyltransferase
LFGKFINHPKILSINYSLSKYGLDLIKLATSIKPTYRFYKDYLKFCKEYSNLKNVDGKVRFAPQLGDLNEGAGIAEGHYFWQDLIAAREIFQNNPERHVDIGSRVDGFIAHLLVFRKVEIIDIRKLQPFDSKIKFTLDDAMILKTIPDNSIESISSLHAIEHFGLGRYGDPIDVDGHRKALKQIQRVLKPKGKFYLSFPAGIPEVVFNDKRVVDVLLPEEILDKCKLLQFIAIPGVGAPIYNVNPSNYRNADGYCGLWIFEKL